MKAYILRRPGLGRGSIKGILANTQEGIEGYLSNGKKHTPTGYQFESPPSDADVVFRWGCTATVPGNPKVFNPASAIHLVSDKRKFRLLTADNGLSPKTAGGLIQALQMLSDGILSYPLVVRPVTHAQGKNLHLVADAAALKVACDKYDAVYVSEFINKTQEFRVFVAMSRVVWVAEKTPADPDVVAWNVAQGGSFANVKWGDWNPAVIENALKAFGLSGLDYGGVDVMVAEGKAYCLEINSAPSQTSPYRQQCVARVFDQIVRYHEDPDYEMPTAYGWKDVIHPAVKGD